MVYFFFSLIINILLLYLVYKKIIAKYTEPNKKEIAEINSLIIEFNKIAKNNIDILEDKIDEIKNVLALVDRKVDLSKSGETKVVKNENKKILNFEAVKKSSSKDIKRKKQKIDKFQLIKELYGENKNAKTIAKILGVSKGEVELYIELIKKQGHE